MNAYKVDLKFILKLNGIVQIIVKDYINPLQHANKHHHYNRMF